MDNDPNSVTDDETQTHHSISIGGTYILLHNEVLNIYILQYKFLMTLVFLIIYTLVEYIMKG